MDRTKPKAPKVLTGWTRISRKLLAATKDKLRGMDNTLQQATRIMAEQRARISTLETQLTEARRRTIPMGDGSELNFLPLGIESMDISSEPLCIGSERGFKQMVRGPVTARIIAHGDAVYFPPGKKT